MITEDYVSFEVAKLLKEKGFDEDIDLWYDENGDIFFQHKYNIEYNWRVRQGLKIYQRTTLQMAMKWLREEKRISIIIEFDVTKRGYCSYVYQLDYDMDWVVKWRVNTPMKYEEAVESALKYCLENLI